MLKRIVGGALLTCLVALSAPALALPITGEVFTAGRFRTDTGDLSNATSLDFGSVHTRGGNGDYSAVNGNSQWVNYRDLNFTGPATTVDPLWSFSVGATVYSFVMESVSILAQDAGQLSLVGSGILYITGYDPTPGNWEFSVTNICTTPSCIGRFKFTADSSTVPEPGTLALLGIGLLGLGLTRRRQA